MKQLTTTNPTSEQDDLLISPYLNHDALPCVLRDMLSLAPNDSQRDMLLLSSLTSISAVMPNLYFRYGVNDKHYCANLQTFVMAAAASGKGIAGLARELVQDIHAKQSLVIPGDSSYPAFFMALAMQNGRGLLFETEGSVITDTWRSQARSYNSALRQAAEHETISRGRAGSNGGIAEIPCPQLSCLLTGTFDQFHALVPSVQNGFYSRLVTYVDRSQVAFMPKVFRGISSKSDTGAAATLAKCRGEVNRLYKQLSRLKQPREFGLTDEQAETLGNCFEHQYAPLVEQLGQSFHASVVRMGITTMRIMMILTALRALEQNALGATDTLFATDDDFHAAVLIATKLLLHTADSFTQIRGDLTPGMPASRSSVQRLTFLAQLPEKFTSGEYETIGKELGIAPRTMERWLCKWAEEGTLTKLRQGIYSKPA